MINSTFKSNWLLSRSSIGKEQAIVPFISKLRFGKIDSMTAPLDERCQDALGSDLYEKVESFRKKLSKIESDPLEKNDPLEKLEAFFNNPLVCQDRKRLEEGTLLLKESIQRSSQRLMPLTDFFKTAIEKLKKKQAEISSALKSQEDVSSFAKFFSFSPGPFSWCIRKYNESRQEIINHSLDQMQSSQRQTLHWIQNANSCVFELETNPEIEKKLEKALPYLDSMEGDLKDLVGEENNHKGPPYADWCRQLLRLSRQK